LILTKNDVQIPSDHDLVVLGPLCQGLHQAVFKNHAGGPALIEDRSDEQGTLPVKIAELDRFSILVFENRIRRHVVAKLLVDPDDLRVVRDRRLGRREGGDAK